MAARCSPGRGGVVTSRAAPVRTVLAAVVALAVAVAGGPVAAPAGAAPLPADWCAPAPSATDLPDTVSGAQVHVVYAYPADAPDRTGALATRIARDLAGVDAWWQAQDPTRTPRFDFADFPGCDSRFGSLDITTLALRGAAATYATSDETVARAVRTEIVRTVGARGAKAYLVYLDAPVTEDDGSVVCGMTFADVAFVFLQQPPGCSVGGGLGTGNGWPARTAAHELVHLLTDGDLTGAPDVCPDDAGHICEPGSNDVLDTASPPRSPFLADAVLDPGRDDYYGHGRPEPVDGRTSALLAHLDEPQQVVGVAVAPVGGGQVASTVSGIACPPACSTAFDGHTSVRLVATAAPGYGFREWSGDCAASDPRCTVRTDAPRTVTATFARLVPYRVRVEGRGRVSGGDGECRDRCTWRSVGRTEVDLTAVATRHSRFVGWTGACEHARKHCRVTVGRRTTVTATFTRR